MMKALQETKVMLGSVAQAAATTPRTALFDSLNASSAKIMVSTSANTNAGTTGVTIAVSTGDNSTSTTGYVSLGSSTATATIDAVRVVDIDMRGKGRYVYVTATPGTAGTTHQVAVGSIVGVFETGLRPDNSTTQLNNTVYA